MNNNGLTLPVGGKYGFGMPLPDPLDNIFIVVGAIYALLGVIALIWLFATYFKAKDAKGFILSFVWSIATGAASIFILSFLSNIYENLSYSLSYTDTSYIRSYEPNILTLLCKIVIVCLGVITPYVLTWLIKNVFFKSKLSFELLFARAYACFIIIAVIGLMALF